MNRNDSTPTFMSRIHSDIALAVNQAKKRLFKANREGMPLLQALDQFQEDISEICAERRAIHSGVPCRAASKEQINRAIGVARQKLIDAIDQGQDTDTAITAFICDLTTELGKVPTEKQMIEEIRGARVFNDIFVLGYAGENAEGALFEISERLLMEDNSAIERAVKDLVESSRKSQSELMAQNAVADAESEGE